MFIFIVIHIIFTQNRTNKQKKTAKETCRSRETNEHQAIEKVSKTVTALSCAGKVAPCAYRFH